MSETQTQNIREKDWLDEAMGTEPRAAVEKAPLNFLGERVFSYNGKHWYQGDMAPKDVYIQLAIQTRKINPESIIEPFDPTAQARRLVLQTIGTPEDVQAQQEPDNLPPGFDAPSATQSVLEGSVSTPDSIRNLPGENSEGSYPALGSELAQSTGVEADSTGMGSASLAADEEEETDEVEDEEETEDVEEADETPSSSSSAHRNPNRSGRRK